MAFWPSRYPEYGNVGILVDAAHCQMVVIKTPELGQINVLKDV
jgi:methylaspartate ammonia-lyase